MPRRQPPSMPRSKPPKRSVRRCRSNNTLCAWPSGAFSTHRKPRCSGPPEAGDCEPAGTAIRKDDSSASSSRWESLPPTQRPQLLFADPDGEPVVCLEPRPGPRAIEDDAFPFEALSEIAEVDGWRKEINHPDRIGPPIRNMRASAGEALLNFLPSGAPFPSRSMEVQ